MHVHVQVYVHKTVQELCVPLRRFELIPNTKWRPFYVISPYQLKKVA